MRFKSRIVVIGALVAALLTLLVALPLAASDGTTTKTLSGVTLKVQVYAVLDVGTPSDDLGVAVIATSARDSKVGNTLYVSNAATTATAFNRVLVTLTGSAGATGGAGNDTKAITIKNVTTNVNITGGPLLANEASTTDTFQLLFDVAAVGAASSASGAAKLAATDAQTLQVLFGDISIDLVVDAKGPTIASTAPADKTLQTGTTATFAGTVTDDASGLRGDTGEPGGNDIDGDAVTAEPLSAAGGGSPDISVNITTDGVGAGGADNDTLATWAAVTNGYNFVFNRPGLAAGATNWNVVATDRAGNTTTTDTDTATAGTQAFLITVDNVVPQIGSAEAGIGYDVANKKEVRDRKFIKLVFTPVGAAPVGVKTGDAGFNGDYLNTTTLQKDDFRVEASATDTTVLAVDTLVHPNAAYSAAVGAVNPKNLAPADIETRHIVYVKMLNDLAPNAKPRVNLVGNVTDVAGNAPAPHAFNAVDAILPKLTVTITGAAHSRPVARGNAAGNEIVVRVDSDEALVGVPTIDFTLLVASSAADGRLAVNATPVPITPTLVAGTTTSWETKQLSAAVSASANSLVNVFVRGTDVNGNSGSSGSGGTATAGAGAGTSVNLRTANLFEIDNALAAGVVALTPNLGGTSTTVTESKSPFIRIDFAEGAEYSIAAADKYDCGAATATAAVLCVITGTNAASVGTAPTAVEIDVHNAVTLTVLTLDGADVLGKQGTIDADSYILNVSNLTVGTHTVAFNGKDAVGNVFAANQSFTFTVKDRTAYKVALSPGWNLVSVPGTPADNKIDAALAGSNASRILTYAPKAAAGPWLASALGADGKWTGTVTTIEANRAYWVLTDQFTPISTLIPDADPAAVLPTIALSAGWNMVSVVDLRLTAQPANLDTYLDFSGDVPVGAAPTSGIDPDVYLAGSNWSVAYGFDTQRNQWRKIIPLTAVQDRVGQGRGYWVWVTKDGTLVP